MCTFLDTTKTQANAQWACISTEPLTSVRLVLGNFLSNGISDASGGTGATSTETASIFYNGTPSQATVSGSSTFTIASGALVFADCTVSIPAFTPFLVKRNIQNPGGILYYPFQNSFFGEATEAATSGLTDKTMSGTISNTYTAGNPQLAGIPPLAVLGMSRKAAFIEVGDSQCVRGVEDTSNTINGVNGKVGIITPSLGSVPFLSLSVAGETLSTWTTRATARGQMVSMGSHLALQLGVNDIGNLHNSVSQIISDAQLIAALARPSQHKIKTTITGHSSSTDGWLTVGNQNVSVGGVNLNATQAPLNQLIRAGLSGFTGVIDMASVFESSQDSGLWKPGLTDDGLHPNGNGLALPVPSGVVGTILAP
jgi:hypothetical protein